EFFQVKDKRNIFRDLTNRYGNVLLTFPLRLFVGGFWIAEAGSKIWGLETWEKGTASFSSIPILFKGLGEGSWLVGSTVRMPFEWLQTATTGASELAEGEWAVPIFSKMPGWFEWIMQIMLPN